MRVYLETNSPEKQTQIAAQMEHLINQLQPGSSQQEVPARDKV